jgi:hypothetical protein
MIVLVTTITDYRQATAESLARAYHERWVRHEALCDRVGVRDPHRRPVAAG